MMSIIAVWDVQNPSVSVIYYTIFSKHSTKIVNTGLMLYFVNSYAVWSKYIV